MKISNPVQIYDFDGWLPSYGENSVEPIFQNGSLDLKINFDTVDGAAGFKIFHFEHTVGYHVTSCPGVHIPNLIYETSSSQKFYGLVEFLDSDMAAAWNIHFQNRFKVRHFQIIFLSENLMVTIFAEDCDLLGS
jgi:hypothetical protein